MSGSEETPENEKCTTEVPEESMGILQFIDGLEVIVDQMLLR